MHFVLFLYMVFGLDCTDDDTILQTVGGLINQDLSCANMVVKVGKGECSKTLEDVLKDDFQVTNLMLIPVKNVVDLSVTLSTVCQKSCGECGNILVLNFGRSCKQNQGVPL